MSETDELVKLRWHICLVTGHPVGTDTRMVGAPPCQCQVCLMDAELTRLQAERESLARTIEGLCVSLETGRRYPGDDMREADQIKRAREQVAALSDEAKETTP